MTRRGQRLCLRAAAAGFTFTFAFAVSPALGGARDVEKMANRAPSLATVDANARAEGNRRTTAVALGEVLFRRMWAAQVLKVRVDGVNSHSVAGLTLSAVKFHRPVDARTFDDEVLALVRLAFAAVPVEEVDVWATTPLDVARGTVVAGDNAQPTSRVVFGVTLRRIDLRAFPTYLVSSHDVYWDLGWRRTLRGARTRGPAPTPRPAKGRGQHRVRRKVAPEREVRRKVAANAAPWRKVAPEREVRRKVAANAAPWRKVAANAAPFRDKARHERPQKKAPQRSRSSGAFIV